MKKENQGITLVALMITIILLLILATVTINMVDGDKILDHANGAGERYDTGMSEKNKLMQNHLKEMEEYSEKTGETGETG